MAGETGGVNDKKIIYWAQADEINLDPTSKNYR